MSTTSDGLNTIPLDESLNASLDEDRGRSTVLDTYEVATNPTASEQDSLHVLFAGESQTKPGHKLGPKFYDYYLLHHVIEGCGEFSTESRTYRLGPGDAFLITPNQLVSYMSDADNPWRYQWIAVKGNQAEALFRQGGLTTEQPVVHCPGTQAAAWMQPIRAAFQAREHTCNLTAAGCMHLMIAAYASQQQRVDESVPLKPENEAQQIVRQMIRMMSTQYAHPFTMEQMASSLGYNRAYLSRLFKQAAGMSPVTFLLKLRIDKGRLLLRERPELTIEQIAASVGIPDALYFSKQFRRFYQQAPSQYRKQALFHKQDRSNELPSNR
ncbi:AraC family transcriptional regulator [Paenibacillus sp. ACRRX]|uniref:AraC family transcriptional regulator n=1 Tax=unclassified Paenibacillus TaxID=185978 RepID=UPI001EF55FEB|nr:MULTISPECIES: AraC family transcriptional regulator [unclassified Paenibacillus]MCG7410282.1 AraC family transcriptional regulator [Paenibacillus sp. ACRRX]MDK8181111.1 AraC family transcriptional regulator [Paenibacillus sp. UMB4589-SE434]